MQRLEYVQHIISWSRYSDAGFILRFLPLHQLTRFIAQVFHDVFWVRFSANAVQHSAGQHSDADELHRLSTAALGSYSLIKARW